VPIVTDRDSGVGAGVVGVGVGVGVVVTGDGLYDDPHADAPTSSVTSNRRFINTPIHIGLTHQPESAFYP